MSKVMRNVNSFLFGFLMVAALTYCVDAKASGTDIEQETIVNTGDNTAVNSVHTSGSRSYGIGHSLGDTDINQCLGSTQWGTPLFSKQKLVLNKWCAAESYDARGLSKMAALMRCDIPEIEKHFSSQAECVKANTQVFHVEPTPAILVDPDDDEDDRLDALYARLSSIEDQRSVDSDNARKAAVRANAAAKRADKAQTERKEYAQQVLQELEQWK